MKDIKILDCTLRDGGYVNDWNFGEKNSKKIIQSLLNSKIDYIETGFLTKQKTTKDKTLFNSLTDFKNFNDQNFPKEKLGLMIKFNDFPIYDILDVEDSPVGFLRLIFKKDSVDEALKYAQILKDKNYKLFINPTFITQYSPDEILYTIEKINKISPYAMTIVDSIGDLDEQMLDKLFNLINNNLDLKTALCFHSHNNLGLSFSNAKKISKLINNRNLIIDSSVLGMGRGAGNLNTKVLCEFLNSNFKKNYDKKEIANIEKKYIKNFHPKNQKEFLKAYYLSAINHCHPDYVKFIAQNYPLSDAFINNVLAKIEADKKTIYDSKTAQNACIEALKS